MNIFFYFSRLLWFFSGLFISALCLVLFIPFAHEQVVRANIFPSLREFACTWLPGLAVLAIIIVNGSIFSRVGKDPVAKTALIAATFVLSFMVAVFGKTGLPLGLYAWWLALLALVVTLAPSLFDLFLALRESFPGSFATPTVREKDLHLFLSLLLTAVAAVGASTDFQFLHLGAMCLTVTLVACIAYALITFLFRLAERAKNPVRAEWLLSGLLLAVFLFWLLSAGVFPALAYNGWGQKVVSALLASAIVMQLLAFSPRSLEAEPAQKPRTGMQILLAPLAVRVDSAIISLFTICVLVLFERVLLERVSLMDWNFLGQKAIVIFMSVAIFAQAQWLFELKSPAWFRIPYPILFGISILFVFVRARPALAEINASSNIVFAMARSSLTVTDWALDEDFSRYLQANSNIPRTTQIDPVAVRLSREEEETGHLSPSQAPRMNVVVIVVDSLRHDYLSAYNPAVSFTPSIGEFAKDAVVFERAFTRYGATGLSEPSIWVGGMLIHKQYVLPFEPMNALQKLLSTDGYQLLISRDSILSQIVTPNENVIDLDPGVSTQDIDLCATLPKVRKHLAEKDPKKPIFAYTQPQNIHISVLNRSLEVGAKPRFKSGFYAPYAEALERIDQCFGEFIHGLKADRTYDDTLIVFTADHGDSLGEDGRFGHAYTLFPEIMRIPLIVHLPKAVKSAWLWNPQQLAFSVDITPSLYRLFGHELTAKSWMWGQSLFWPTDEQHKTDQRREPYLLVSSYGAVYGLLDGDGTDLYISDAVNLRDYSFDLRSNPPVAKDLSADERNKKTNLIRSRIREINDYYGFKGANDEN